METIKDEQLIRKFDIKAWYSDQILNLPFSVSHPITLSFTNKRVHYSSSIEMLNYSYENIAGIEVLKTLLPVRRKYVITPVIVYFALVMIGIGLKITWLVPYFVSLLVIIPLVIIIGKTRVYKVSLISQNSGVLCGFFIDRDEKLIHEIQQTFEHGKQNTVKSAFTTQGQANHDKQVKTLEDLKKAKELLDLGAISQDEFEAIKIQALGQNAIAKAQLIEKPIDIPVPPKENIFAPPFIATKSKKQFKWKPIIIVMSILVLALPGFYAFQSFTNTDEEMATKEFQKLSEQTEAPPSGSQFQDDTYSSDVVDSSLYSNQPDFTKNFIGSINNKYKIDLTLTKEGKGLSGSYYYVGKESKLLLTGQIEDDGKFVIEELSSGNVTGKFTGRIIGNNVTGTWSDRSGETTLPFTISEVNTNTDGFFTTTEGLRYRKLVIQVPNHDEAVTNSEQEVIGPVEGMYISKNDGKSRSIQINYDGDKIYVLHWNDSENAKRENAYVTSKGYLAFGSEEFEYDSYGETVTEVKNLSLVERFTGQVFVWNTEWQGD